MSDYIKREDAINIINHWWGDSIGQWLAKKIKNMPSADVAPVRHGHWIFNQDEMSLHCSYCDEVFRFEDAEKDECLDFMEYAKYCLSCGTRMDGESDE